MSAIWITAPCDPPPDVRKLLTDRDIVPEQLPAAEDVKKLEGRLKSEAKELPKQTSKLASPKK